MNSGNLNTTITGLANIGGSSQDLTDDHPLGFDFFQVSGEDDKILPLGNAIANGMKFFKAGAKLNQMECASCHDVHNNSVPAEPAFLRTSLLSGAICISCHDESKF
jgi:predicted CXXCH cytochrome family protein